MYNSNLPGNVLSGYKKTPFSVNFSTCRGSRNPANAFPSMFERSLGER